MDHGLNLTCLKPELSEVLVKVCHLISDAGGRAWLVGGTVRDMALGCAGWDLDLEVFGLPADRLRACLNAEFELDLVGQSFGILKIKGWPIDVGLPRRETKIGLGHKGFEVHSDPDMGLSEAAARRDFTLNAIYLDPLTGTVEDPWDGLADLRRGVLRHTSDAFAEDPLRVLRGMQFAARFDLQVQPETVAVCRTIDPEGLPGERIWGEWVKLITLGKRPSRGLNFLHDCGWLAHFPQLDALRGCVQDPNFHPEGDAWVHTVHCMDAFADDLTADPWEDLVVGCAVLCHDLGKPTTTTTADDGRIRSLGHEQASVELTRTFLGAMTNNRKLLAEVEPLVAEHMRPNQLFHAHASSAAIRRLATRVGRIDRLVRVARADMFGRPPLPTDSYPAGDWLIQKAEGMEILHGPPAPLLLGRHLIVLGEQPGRTFRNVLDQVYQAQLAGTVSTTEEGIALARRILAE